MKRLMLSMAVFIGACDLPLVPERTPADVYDYRLLTPEPLVLRWPLGSTIRVFISQDTDAARNAALQNGLDNAISAWNAAALYREFTLEQTTDIANADAVLLFFTTLGPVNAGNCPPGGGLAYTTFCLDESGEHLSFFPLIDGGESRVKFLVTIRNQNQLDSESVRRLIAHEIGHVLGIGQHSHRPTDLMYDGVLSRAEPSPGDRATLQVLYHTRADITP